VIRGEVARNLAEYLTHETVHISHRRTTEFRLSCQDVRSLSLPESTVRPTGYPLRHRTRWFRAITGLVTAAPLAGGGQASPPRHRDPHRHRRWHEGLHQ
jgi:hypothetical protein